MIPIIHSKSTSLRSLEKVFNVEQEVSRVTNNSKTAGLSFRDQLFSTDDTIREPATHDLERILVTRQGHCNAAVTESLRIQTFQLSPGKIDQVVNGGVGRYDHNFQDGMGCLVDGMVSNNTGFPDARLRRWVDKYNRIGNNTLGGMAFSAINDRYNMFAIKVPLAIIGDKLWQTEELTHEALVGLAALNNLRSKIPNFVHTYGVFSCTAPLFEISPKSKKIEEITAWCSSEKSPVYYLVLEYIDGAVSFSDIAASLTGDEYLQIYLQVINALNVAYHEYDFTHYDLHSGNVLIKKLSSPMAIPLYMKDGSVKYIITSYLARIIDFGMSHVAIDGYHFGLFGMEQHEIYPARSFPLMDAYKLLLFSYEHSLKLKPYDITKHSRSLITTMANDIYDFFGDDLHINIRLVNHSHDMGSDFYQYDTELDIMDKSLDSLIQYIMDSFDPPFVHDTIPLHIANTICTDSCMGWDTFMHTIFDERRIPQKFEDFYHAVEIADRLPDSTQKTELIQWLKQFDYQTAFKTEYSEHVKILDKLTVDLAPVKLPKYPTIKDPKILATFEQSYRTELEKIANIVYQLKECKVWSVNVLFSLKYLGQLKPFFGELSTYRSGIAALELKIYSFNLEDRANISVGTVDSSDPRRSNVFY
jgi:serine/threonine protein kinase